MDDTCIIDRLRAHGVEASRLAAPFPLWQVSPRDGSQAELAALLGQAERQRAARFAVDSLARRYRAAHGALRLLVEAEFGVPAARQDYTVGAHGKPFLPHVPYIRSNISYSAGRALVAISGERDIGVDIEKVRPIGDALDVAELYYTAREREQMGACPVAEIDRAFLTVWVRKEACSKAISKGLAIAPSSFECGTGCGQRRVYIDGEVVESDVIDPKGGFLVSWALRQH